ncbi:MULTISPECIES: TIGR03086 family metal-binding protein [unclassified Streptomyces]|uniref:TIGR03086 family metal-binding protein n=1 Tax=unclassified Streptomyces TaxID=2593676 RepID=UPI002E80A35B|nr:TIGR03086 family metal-binding protein [Streptomyces sp. NBC_00589]WTI41905.1 TIGR03086 family metal-binding protein [Streptomyces sp. NBC_00775]WUB24412.1 TIGR03086 family metal-binding protein [Streptomyces sp. NBC_00589]
MTRAADEHRAVAGVFTDRVRQVRPGAWDNPAPCEGWVARDVVRHLVEWFPDFLKAGAGVELPKGPSVDDDPVAAWTVHSDGVQALLDDPATAQRMLSNPHVGEVALDQAVDRFYTADVFMHTWDLARATGQEERLDPGRCAQLLDGMLPLDDVLRNSGQYGPRVEVPENADVQTRLLAFIGRKP